MGEVDSICQSNFSAEEMLSDWDTWKKMISDFSTDKNIHRKRVSLVLLTSPVRESTNPELSRLAFVNIERLKGEKDILITRAVSWLLRNLIKNHKNEVKNYLNKNKSSLPKITVLKFLKSSL